MPPERWPEIEEAVQRLRPIASEALMAIFQQRLSSQIEGGVRRDHATALGAAAR